MFLLGYKEKRARVYGDACHIKKSEVQYPIRNPGIRNGRLRSLVAGQADSQNFGEAKLCYNYSTLALEIEIRQQSPQQSTTTFDFSTLQAKYWETAQSSKLKAAMAD